jgi:peptidoglycan/LPS O-acetylase OafA/YrhL
VGPPAPRDTATPAPTAATTAFRPELQGLRAVAVALVVVYHVWFNRVSGGVDVFFVLSGFLLTGQLARAAERGVGLDLARRWSRTVVRLVPAVAVVLAGTVVAAALLLPEGRWVQTVREVGAAALFLENWQLAADSVDYAAQNNVASVVQQFWSLSIQGQFFLIWPLLVAAVVAGGPAATVRSRLVTALAAVFVLSLGLSALLTAQDQPFAYFHSLTRVWEFALGGLLALTIDAIALRGRARLLAGWAGVLGLLVCGIVFDVGAVFPGVAALWPTLCAALVLAAGSAADPRGADRWLAARPVQYLGDLSFTLYLWHWPVLVLYLVAREREQVGLLGGAGIIALSLALAAATHHGVERPLIARGLGVRAGFRLGAACTAAVLLLAVAWQAEAASRSVVTARVGDAQHPGALALRDGPVDPAPLLPPPVAVYDDWAAVGWDCTPMAAFPSDVCAQPVEGDPRRTVVLVGDSHVQQLIPALEPLAAREGWQLVHILRGACPFSTASEVDPGDLDCVAWNDAAVAEIAALGASAVVTLGSRDVRVGPTERTPPGFVEQWRRLDELGVPVLAVRDNPRFDVGMPDCVAGGDPAGCGAPREALYPAAPPWTAYDDLPGNVAFLDLADLVCTAEFCPAVVGNVLVYLDDNHLSASYAASLAPLVEADVRAVVGG